MSETKHTPGPWGIADWGQFDGPNRNVVEAYEPEVVEPGRHSIWRDGIRRLHIASVQDSSVDIEETKANARLIVAAPELLEASEAIIERWDSTQWTWAEHTSVLIHRLRAAIAKAKGEGV